MNRSLLLGVLLTAGCSTASSSGDLDAVPGASDRTVATSRCSMGFRELFFLAKGREWTPEEVKAFQTLDQPGRNRAVKHLASDAGCIQTEDQVGTDGVVYTAFWKK